MFPTRINVLKEERIRHHSERIASMKEELLREDRMFQASFKQMEQQLDHKKVIGSTDVVLNA